MMQYREKQGMSRNLFNATIGGLLLWGFLVNYVLVTEITPAQLAQFHPIAIIAVYAVSCIAGILIVNLSSSAPVKFVGYNLIVVPVGVVLAVLLKDYSSDAVINAILNAGGITGIMMVLGFIYPDFFNRLEKLLFASLLISVVVELISIFVFGIELAWMDWVVALIFSGYIGYYWGTAQRVTTTLGSAIEVATGLYLSIINLFIRLLDKKS